MEVAMGNRGRFGSMISNRDRQDREARHQKHDFCPSGCQDYSEFAFFCVPLQLVKS